MPEENKHTPPSGEQEEFEEHSPQPAGNTSAFVFCTIHFCF